MTVQPIASDRRVADVTVVMPSMNWVRVLRFGTGVALGRTGFTYTVHAGQASRNEELVQRARCGPRLGAVTAGWVPRGTAKRTPQGCSLSYLRWFAARPHTWVTLLDKLMERRGSRHHRAP